MSKLMDDIEKQINHAKAKTKEKKAEHDLKKARKQANEDQNPDSSVLF